MRIITYFGQSLLTKTLFYKKLTEVILCLQGESHEKTIRALVIAGVVLISLYTITQPVKAYPHTSDGEGFPLASQLTITSPSENSVNNPKSLVLDISFQLMLSLKHATVTYT
jgi:hypothetical protein